MHATGRLSPLIFNIATSESNFNPVRRKIAGLRFPAIDTYIGFEVPAAKSVAPPLSANSMSKPMLNDVYNTRIIELAGNIPRLGRLAAPDASATAHSKLCGSTVKIDLKMDGSIITDFAHDVKACALGQASSSIMARHVVGSTASEQSERPVQGQLTALVRENEDELSPALAKLAAEDMKRTTMELGGHGP